MCKFKLFTIAAAALMMAACSTDDIAQLINGDKKNFTATLAAPNKGGTRTAFSESSGTINVAWVKGDEIALVHNGKKDVATVSTINNDGSATITGTLTGATNGADVKLVYPASFVAEVTEGTAYSISGTAKDKMLSQDGTLKYIEENLDFREGSSTLAVTETEATLAGTDNKEMATLNAIWKLTLSDGTNNLSATQVKIKGGESVLASTTTLTTATSEVTLAIPTDVAIDGALTIEATVGSDTYAYTKAEGATFNSGTYYQSTVTMAPQGYAAIDYNEASWDGTKVVLTKKSATNPTAVTSSTVGTWSDGWYTVSGDVTINGNVTLGANTDLILQDGATLTINGRLICSTPLHSYNLNIYGQEAGTGKLNITNSADAIYTSGTYYIKIHGGEITAQSTSKSGIRGGIIEMYAGKLTATTNNDMGNAAISYPNGDFIVYGGEVTAENTTTTAGTGNPALSNANTTSALKVFGGKVKATGGNGSKGIKGYIMSGTSGIKFYFSDNGTDWDAGTYYEAATTAPTNRYAKAYPTPPVGSVDALDPFNSGTITLE